MKYFITLSLCVLGGSVFADQAVKPFNGKNLDGWKQKGPAARSHLTVGTAKLDAGVHASDVTCVVTGGTCDVLGVDSTGRLAQFTWTLPASPGHHEVAVTLGDPRWAAVAYGRVSVEAP